MTGPTAFVQAFYSAIGGAYLDSGSYTGFWAYQCNQLTTVSLTFGGIAYTVSQEDFQLGRTNAGLCVGALYAVDVGDGSFTIGDTFMKNVFSVFRYDPPAVGFARLSDAAIAEQSVSEPVPTFGSQPTIVAKGYSPSEAPAQTTVREESSATLRTSISVSISALVLLVTAMLS